MVPVVPLVFIVMVSVCVFLSHTQDIGVMVSIPG